MIRINLLGSACCLNCRTTLRTALDMQLHTCELIDLYERSAPSKPMMTLFRQAWDENHVQR